MEIYSDEDFEYALIDNEAFVLKWLSTSKTNIVIPTEVKGRTVTKLYADLFLSKRNITSVDALSIKYVGDSVFRGCTALTTVNLPNVEYIEDSAFSDSTRLQTIDFPKVEYIGGSCFESCTGLISVNAPMLKKIASYAFNGCQQLSTFSDMKNVTFIGTKAFYGCINLTSAINLPKVKILYSNTFYGCKKIPSINIPLVISIGSLAFYGTTSLTELSLPSIDTIENQFLYDSNVTSLTLGGVGKPITTTDNFSTEAFSGWSTPANVTIHVSDPSNPPTLTGSPWGKLNATIIYEQA